MDKLKGRDGERFYDKDRDGELMTLEDAAKLTERPLITFEAWAKSGELPSTSDALVAEVDVLALNANRRRVKNRTYKRNPVNMQPTNGHAAKLKITTPDGRTIEYEGSEDGVRAIVQALHGTG